MHSITLNQIWKKKLGLPWTLDPPSERSGPSKKIKYGVWLYNRREFLYYLVQISLGGSRVLWPPGPGPEDGVWVGLQKKCTVATRIQYSTVLRVLYSSYSTV